MRIAVDITTLQGKNLSGIGRYVLNLINGIQINAEIDLITTHRMARLKKIRHKNSFDSVPLYPKIPALLNCDLFHGPDFKIPRTHRFKKIVTIHDLLIFQDNLINSRFKKSSIEKFDYMMKKCKPDHIIAVSNFVKDQILDYDPSYKNSISVVYHGIDHIIKSDSIKKIVHDPYLLFVGNIERRKNIIHLIQAFEAIQSDFPEIKLVLAGGKGFEGDAVIKYIQNSKIKNKIIYKGYVSDEDMINLFVNAMAFVYPSIYEGFGFPILEAMQLGTPVITSNIGVMKEIGESAAMFFDPFNPEDIGEKIKTVLQQEELRKKLIVKGYEHAKKFTWKKCVNQTIDVYSTALAYQNSAF